MVVTAIGLDKRGSGLCHKLYHLRISTCMLFAQMIIVYLELCGILHYVYKINDGHLGWQMASKRSLLIVDRAET